MSELAESPRRPGRDDRHLIRPETTEYAPLQEVEGRVIRASTNGLTVELPNGEHGFVIQQEICWPGYEVTYKPGAHVMVQVVSFKPGKCLFLSIRKAQVNVSYQKMFSTIKVGDVLDGRVKRTVGYGTFVSIGPGVDGLLHNNAIPDDSFPSKIHYGDAIRVRIKHLDHSERKIALELA